uniref:EGF-like domain-containing protein n=1 Tax=Mola mola TaxID=94237 RepID=A0A3Q3WM18_MOLML
MKLVLCPAGVMLLWPYVFAKSVSSSSSLAAGIQLANCATWQGEVRPHVVKRSTEKCDSMFDNYCMNNGKCMLLVDINEHHCICDKGFYGPRCSKLDLVMQPVAEEEIILTVFCVSLLIIGLLGALYFCRKWYKKNRFQSQPKHQGYKGVQGA